MPSPSAAALANGQAASARASTLVMATHSPEVVGVADRVFTIHEGRLEISRP
jgi:ABC-type lipoprotein export system ATPase subunit